jgi:multidrug efflux pump subunit AcrB
MTDYVDSSEPQEPDGPKNRLETFVSSPLRITFLVIGVLVFLGGAYFMLEKVPGSFLPAKTLETS